MPESLDKVRLDMLVMAACGFSRAYAGQVIADGQVLVAGKPILKPGAKYSSDTSIQVMAAPMPFVSRGGYKLQKALDVFSVSPAGKLCIDVGASTGGFTDCMLQRSAAKVYAVDTGHGQLAEALRNDPRVVSLEGTNIQSLQLPEPAQFLAGDVSFVSLTKLMASMAGLLAHDGELILLIKPQFEAGQQFLSKSGVVKDFRVHKRIILGIYESMIRECLGVLGLTASPILGQAGNHEYLIYGRKDSHSIGPADFEQLVDSAIKAAKDLS